MIRVLRVTKKVREKYLKEKKKQKITFINKEQFPSQKCQKSIK